MTELANIPIDTFLKSQASTKADEVFTMKLPSSYKNRLLSLLTPKRQSLLLIGEKISKEKKAKTPDYILMISLRKCWMLIGEETNPHHYVIQFEDGTILKDNSLLEVEQVPMFIQDLKRLGIAVDENKAIPYIKMNTDQKVTESPIQYLEKRFPKNSCIPYQNYQKIKTLPTKVAQSISVELIRLAQDLDYQWSIPQNDELNRMMLRRVLAQKIQEIKPKNKEKFQVHLESIKKDESRSTYTLLISDTQLQLIYTTPVHTIRADMCFESSACEINQKPATLYGLNWLIDRLDYIANDIEVGEVETID